MNIEQLMSEITSWADTASPDQPVLGKLSHLRDEVRELQVAVDDGSRADIEDELADCWILLLNISRKLGFTEQHIEHAITSKMRINRSRIWGRKGKDGQIYHIKPL